MIHKSDFVLFCIYFALVLILTTVEKGVLSHNCFIQVVVYELWNV